MEHQGKGAFAPLFIVLGLFIALFGSGVTAMVFGGGFPTWNAGLGVETDGLILGALFIVMGVGFALFGILADRQGWTA